ncbi:hypothetical protein [Photobacterium kishitanii]|uniref:Uncharacterized protein n=1 Tax=Photobacterium kishitanii TaxID=318456 RepID=A0A2T3KKZ9_9GAMM|nr:hypothetical protein [Photobacterium kishitanii]PSV00395.1 hypothetical protein C9J27_04505 [Photobacterium kishitanii]
MSFLKKHYRKVWDSSVGDYIEKHSGFKIDRMRGNEVLDLLFVDSKDGEGFHIRDSNFYSEQEGKHRVNTLWVSLLTIVSSPYRYVRYGHTGWDQYSPIGKWLQERIGTVDNVTKEQVREYVNKDGYKKIEDMSALQALEKIFGDSEYCNRYDLLHTYKSESNTWQQRLNMFWAFPVVMICKPFRYVLYGHTELDHTTKFGRWILKAISNN